MHKQLSFSIIFSSKYNRDKIIKILAKGKEELSFKYYDYIWGEVYFEAPELSVEKALVRMENKNDESPILCRHQDTSFYFNFYDENNHLTLFIWSASYPWKKEFLNGISTVEFDMQRYIRLILPLANDLKINKIEAKIEWV